MVGIKGLTACGGRPADPKSLCGKDLRDVSRFVTARLSGADFTVRITREAKPVELPNFMGYRSRKSCQVNS